MIGNHVSIIGRFTQNPEIKTAGEHKVMNFTIARNRRTTKDHQEADFFDCVAWDGLADFIAKYFTKGSKIGIDGTLQTRIYESNGVKRKITEIIVNSTEFVNDAPKNGEANNNSNAATGSTPTNPESKPVEENPAYTSDDDLPF